MTIDSSEEDVPSQVFQLDDLFTEALRLIELSKPRAEVDFAMGVLLFEIRAARVRTQQEEQTMGGPLGPL